MSVTNAVVANDGSGSILQADTVWQDSSGLSYADYIVPLPSALPGIDPSDESTRQHATLDALQADIALAMGATDAANATAGQIVADLEARIDASLLPS